MTRGPGITRTKLPKGFSASGINCGVRKYRPDLGLVFSDRDCTAAGVYTKNEYKAAAVHYCEALTPAAQIRAIVTNSGQANAATGANGVVHNLRMAQAVASALGCEANQVLTASTGVIGVPLDITKIEAGIPDLVAEATETAEAFAVAILTTDLIPKTVSTDVVLSGGTVTITGIAKGSGMIHPNMATMLGYLLTDAAVAPAVAATLLKETTDVSFNMISVDGETSTNDSAFLLANGASGVDIATPEDLAVFGHALREVAQVLAKAIARDGEGATKLIEIELEGVPTDALARKAARGLTVSPLLKAAMHGEDPNWGRVLARLGAEGVPASSLNHLCVTIQDFKVLEKGEPLSFDREALRTLLKQDTVRIHVALGSGEGRAVAWGCDLSKRYVSINAEYST